MKKLICAILLLFAVEPAFAEMQVTSIQWQVGDGHFSGFVVYDDSSSSIRPGVVMLPNWMGVGEEAIEMAKRIAADDYIVLVADLYGSETRPTDDVQALAAAKAAYFDGGRTLRERAAKAVETLRAQHASLPLDPARIGVVGFCFGGGIALELARSGFDLPGGVVSFHGNLDSYFPADKPIRTSILVLNGAADTSVSHEQIMGFQKEMTVIGADWQLVNFGGARHCFSQDEDANNPPESNCRYDRRTAVRAFGLMRSFLSERFSAE